MILPVALTFAAVAALFNFWLALRISQVRRGRKILVGDGGDALCIARMRAQANFVEYTPFILILIGLIEFARGWALGLWIIGALYMVARVAHAFGMERTTFSAPRAFGAGVTFLSLIVLAGWALAIAYRLA